MSIEAALFAAQQALVRIRSAQGGPTQKDYNPDQERDENGRFGAGGGGGPSSGAGAHAPHPDVLKPPTQQLGGRWGETWRAGPTADRRVAELRQHFGRHVETRTVPANAFAGTPKATAISYPKAPPPIKPPAPPPAFGAPGRVKLPW